MTCLGDTFNTYFTVNVSNLHQLKKKKKKFPKHYSDKHVIHITICGDTLVEQFIDFILLPLGEYLNNIPIDNVHTNYIDAVKTGLY